MTTHELLSWVVPFFAMTTVIGAALSIARLFPHRSTNQQEPLSYKAHAEPRKYHIRYRLHQLAILAAALGAAVASAILAFRH